MPNFSAFAALNERLNVQEGSGDFRPPTYTNQGFHWLPEDPDHPDPDKFYGYVFQDTDFSKRVEALGTRWRIIRMPMRSSAAWSDCGYLPGVSRQRGLMPLRSTACGNLFAACRPRPP